MTPRDRRAWSLYRVLTDITLVVAAWVVAFHLRFHSFLPVPRGIPNATLYFKLIPFIIGIWLATWWAAGLYHRSRRKRSAVLEALDIIPCSALATMVFIVFSFFYEEYRYSRITLLIFAAIHPWFVIAGRSLLRKTSRWLRLHTPSRRVLLIGGGETMRQVVHLDDPDLTLTHDISGVMLVGAQEAQDRAFCEERHLKVQAIPADWARHFAENPAETVILALPHASGDFLGTHLERLVDQVPDIRLVPDIARFTRLGAGIDIVQGTPVINVHESPLAGVGSTLKRAMDIVGALTAILLFSPVMILTAIGVKLSSPGPFLYRQERMGLDGRTFEILKFRSMPVNAEAATGAKWATADDHRATRFGSLIRRTSLDELPQLFNVLFGHMSMVGPRPERPVFVHDFRTKIPGYMLRHKVKAGITGWAQVNGWRGNTSLERRIECDLWYIQNWSLWLDIKILLFTVFKGFVNKNAY
jgi:Undecaprenyl-phosphate glucose phosphotransferase